MQKTSSYFGFFKWKKLVNFNFGISKKRNNFLNTGEFLKQDYDIALKVVQPRLIPGGILI